MNPDAYKQPEAKPKAWKCPCSGCAKAVKQERTRVIEELDLINIDNIDSKLELITLIKHIIEPPKSEAKK